MASAVSNAAKTSGAVTSYVITQSVIQSYASEIEVPVPPPGQESEWVQLPNTQPDNSVWEHARWLDTSTLEELLGGSLDRAMIRSNDLSAGSSEEPARLISSQEGDFVALINEQGRLDGILDRKKYLEHLARSILEDKAPAPD